MCRRSLDLALQFDGESKALGIGSIGAGGLFLNVRILRFMLNVSANSFWYATLDAELSTWFSLPVLLSVSTEFA